MQVSLRRRALHGSALLAISALLVVGCGEDDEETTTAAAETSAASTSESETIVDVAASNPDFSILVAAVEEAGLAETLSGDGPYTVFAPTNEAFAAALEDLGLTEDELLASPDLEKILTYHVLSGDVMAADITEAMTVTTVEGSDLEVAPDGATVKVGPNATVVQADVTASNGVIHAIDAVLIPPDVDLSS